MQQKIIYLKHFFWYKEGVSPWNYIIDSERVSQAGSNTIFDGDLYYRYVIRLWAPLAYET